MKKELDDIERNKLAKVMATHAKEFKSVALRCSLDKHWHAEVVNWAFATEVALKALHVLHTGRIVLGHDLAELFKNLPTNVLILFENDENKVTFDEGLMSVSRAFEQWRYAYERPELSLRLDFLKRLCDACIALLTIEVSEAKK